MIYIYNYIYMYMIINYQSFLDFQYRPSVATREQWGSFQVPTKILKWSTSDNTWPSGVIPIGDPVWVFGFVLSPQSHLVLGCLRLELPNFDKQLGILCKTRHTQSPHQCHQGSSKKHRHQRNLVEHEFQATMNKCLTYFDDTKLHMYDYVCMYIYTIIHIYIYT